MIQMIFSLKYQSQLRRTMPDLYANIEKTITECVSASGGRIKQEYHCITAIFNEETIGFWLDILTIIETIRKALQQAERDLYGHICVFSYCIEEDQIQLLLRSLPTVKNTSGFWCSQPIQESLNKLFFFSEPYALKESAFLPAQFIEINAVKTTEITEKQFPLRKKVGKILRADNYRNTVLVGKDFIGKRDCLHWYCKNVNSGFLPLTIRYGTWGRGLSCYADAWNPDLRNLVLQAGVAVPEDMEELYSMLFNERLRSECSMYSIEKAEKFLQLLFEAYVETAQIRKCIPIIILENIQDAEIQLWQIFTSALEAQSQKMVVYATCASSEAPSGIKNIFPGIISCLSENIPNFSNLDLNPSLLEIAFACGLFGQYFPAYLFVNLFEEEGKNPETIQKSFELLLKNGIIRSLEDPQPEETGFIENFEAAFPERANYVRAMVKNRLLSWVADGKLKPCFKLLETLHSLGFEASDLLALEAVRQDIINGTYADIERAIDQDYFSAACGTERAGALFYIYKTMKALNFGDETEIRETFKIPQASNITIDAYKAQILTINAIYKIGINDARTAVEEIKEAMLICQNNRDRSGISQVYRLFSLVHLYNKDISDAMDYIVFAIEETERNRDFNEMAVVSYYSAAANFIFGNISKAQRLIMQAEKAAVISGRKEWALRSRFLMGRFYFEIGLYKDALNVFTSLMENWKDDPASKQYLFLSNWSNRAKLYLADKTNETPVFNGGDGKIFEIEAAYLFGDYKKTIALADAMIASQTDMSFHFLEQPDWTSGFAQCELLLYSKKDYWYRMVTVWRSLALCKVDKTRANEAVHIMQQIMRDERMADIDPNASFYFFANFLLLDETGANEVDRNTAISMAFKRLQRRASRIDDIETRRTYLASQYWNKILFATAKEYKLI